MKNYELWKERRGAPRKNLGRLLQSKFSKGDRVVLITTNDEFLWGKIQWTKDEITLTRIGGKSIIVPWMNVTFLSHDASIMKVLKGADGSKSIDKEDTTGLVELLRKSIDKSEPTDRKDVPELVKRLRKFYVEFADVRKTKRLYLSRFTNKEMYELRTLDIPEQQKIWISRCLGGDPFILEGVSFELWNSGNSTWKDKYTDNAEFLLVSSHEGAQGIWWALPETLKFFE